MRGWGWSPIELDSEVNEMRYQIRVIGWIVVLCSAHDVAQPEENDQSAGTRLTAKILTLAEQAQNVSLSPDGRVLAIRDQDDVVTLRDAKNGQVKQTLNVGLERPSCFEFSPKGQTIAVVERASTIRLWDLDSGTEHRRFQQSTEVLSLAFSPDGKTLAASSGRNGEVILWDVASGQQLQSLAKSMIFSLAFSTDGKLLATGDPNGDVIVWDWVNGTQIGSLDVSPALANVAESIAFFNDNKTLIVTYGLLTSRGASFYGVRLWDVTTGEQTAVLATEGQAKRIAVSPDERIAAVALNAPHSARFAGIVLFDLIRHERILSFPAHEKGQDRGHPDITTLQFSASGKQLISAGRDGKLKYWDLALEGQKVGVDQSK